MPHLSNQLFLFFGVLLLLAILMAVIKGFIARRRKPRAYPYEKEQSLFTPAERSFLGVLEQALNPQYRVFGKVRLVDVIRVQRGLSRATWQTAFNQVQSKHIDLVVCDPSDLSVQFVAELDDKSHGKVKRQNRDEFVNRALAVAEVPIFRFPAKTGYSVKEIQNQMFRAAETEGRPDQALEATT